MLNSLLPNFFTARSEPTLPAEIPSADDTVVVYANPRRGRRLYQELERRTGFSGPPGGTGDVGRLPGKAALSLHTPRQGGNDAPLRGHLIDSHTLVLRAPDVDDASRARLIGALMHHNVGLIVDLSTGESCRTGLHGLSSTWDGELPTGERADICRVDTPPAQGLPERATTVQLDLMLAPPACHGKAAARTQKCSIDLVELGQADPSDALTVAEALALVRHCQRHRQDCPDERIAFLSVDGRGPAAALAGMERIFGDWTGHRLRPAEVDAVTLRHARDLTALCGAFSLMEKDLTTMADFTEYLAANPLSGAPDDQRRSTP